MMGKKMAVSERKVRPFLPVLTIPGSKSTFPRRKQTEPKFSLLENNQFHQAAAQLPYDKPL
jgi:hypothetical protein